MSHELSWGHCSQLSHGMPIDTAAQAMEHSMASTSRTRIPPSPRAHRAARSAGAVSGGAGRAGRARLGRLGSAGSSGVSSRSTPGMYRSAFAVSSSGSA